MELKLLPADSLALSSGDPGLMETAVWEEWKAKGIGKAVIVFFTCSSRDCEELEIESS